MKTRQRMSHQELIGEVLEQLRFFKPDTRVIKRRFEHLINNDYMERSEENRDIYE